MATTINLPPDLHDQVRRIAAAERRSIAQTLIIAVEEYVERNQRAAKVEALSARIAGEDADLLQQLA